MTRQPENFLYNDNAYQLPGPAPVLAPPSAGGLSSPGPQSPFGSSGPPGPPAPQPHQPDAKSPREWLLFVVWRQKWLIAATVILAAVGAMGYLSRATPLYTSTAKISVRPLIVNVGPGATSGSPDGSAAPGPNYLNAEKETITGSGVLAIAATLQDVLQTDLMKSTTDPVEALRGSVAADVDKTSDLILVSASCNSPEDAATVANGVVKAYQLYQTRSSTDQTSSIDKQLETLRDEQRAINERIRGQSEQLTEMEKKWGVLSRQDDRSNIVFRRLQALSEALTNAQAEESDAKMAADEATRSFGGLPSTRPGAPQPTTMLDDDLPITTPQEMAVLRAEMLQTQTQLQELEQRYMPEHPAIASRRRMLSGLRRKYVVAVQRRAEAAANRVADLQSKYDDEQKRAVDVDAHAAEYARVKDDQSVERAKRDSLAGQIRNIELSRALGELKVDQRESAKVALHPSSPNRPKTMGVALAIGLSLGLLFACMREWVDDRFRSAGEIKTSLGMPLLAVIPQSTTKRSPSVSGQRILLDPGSDTAEAYRALRAAILYSAPEGQMRTLLVTSPSSGDGKTTLVSNLAIAMAQGGRKVLIVDADLRNPSQHDIFGVKNNTGLSALLAGRCSLETAVQRSQVQNLEILPCGPTPANPAEILNSREFGETLETLADKYDCVVLDSPPVEAVADARIIAASCDATLIVLKAQTAHRRTTEHTRDSLTSVGARVLGVVVNDLPRRTTSGYGGRSAAARRYVPGLTNVAEPEVINGKGK